MVGGLCARPCKARCSGKGAELVQDPGRAVVGAPPRGPGRRAAERGYRGTSGDDRPLAGPRVAEDTGGRCPPALRRRYPGRVAGRRRLACLACASCRDGRAATGRAGRHAGARRSACRSDPAYVRHPLADLATQPAH